MVAPWVLALLMLGVGDAKRENADSQPVANLVGNPSFEAGQGEAHEWERFAPKGAVVRRFEGVWHSGKASGGIEVAPEGTGEYPALKYAVNGVRCGEVYQGEAWARSEGMVGLGGYLVIEFLRGGERLSFAQGDYAGAGSHDWKRLTVRGMVPEGAESLKLGLVAHGTGKVWFDDARLVRTREAPPEFHGKPVRLRVRPERVLCRDFLGFGAQGDFFLTLGINVDRGVDEQDRQRVLRRVEAMRPHVMRTFFDYKWWEPEEGKTTRDSEQMRDYLLWVGFLKRIGTAVLLTPWGDHFGYSPWMRPEGSKLPALEKREAMLRSLVDVLAFLRRERGLDNVKYLCLMNEPDNDPPRPVPVDEYVRMNRRLDQLLRERGLRGEIFLLGADECSGGPCEASEWYRQVVSRGVEYCDGVSVHTYKHEYVPELIEWMRPRMELLRKMGGTGSPKPLLITEFGYGGETFKNWANDKYEYGLFLADFAVTALREGASAALMWCLMDTYYDRDHCQEYGLWRYKDRGWEPRPGFYSWSLLTRYTRPGSRVVEVEVEPATPSVRAVALISPNGELSVLLVNRYKKAVPVGLDVGLGRDAVLRVYRYTRSAMAAASGEMIGQSETVAIRKGSAAELNLAEESFVLLTEAR